MENDEAAVPPRGRSAGNRFVRRIKSGEIESEEALRTEFRALARRLHPDVAGSASHEEFIGAMAEYEAALRNFDRHRFGSIRRGHEGGRQAREAGPTAEREADARLLAAELSLLLGRGFPKRPRHEKETLRYEYARWRFLRTLGTLGVAWPSRFEAFERELLEAKRSAPAPGPGARPGPPSGTEDQLPRREDAERAIAIVRGVIDHVRKPLPALRTAVELEYDSLRESGAFGPEAIAFLGRLVAELGDGKALR